jgi:hypothetical protein
MRLLRPRKTRQEKLRERFINTMTERGEDYAALDPEEFDRRFQRFLWFIGEDVAYRE